MLIYLLVEKALAPGYGLRSMEVVNYLLGCLIRQLRIN
jgi:hypothetical protein